MGESGIFEIPVDDTITLARAALEFGPYLFFVVFLFSFFYLLMKFGNKVKHYVIFQYIFLFFTVILAIVGTYQWVFVERPSTLEKLYSYRIKLFFKENNQSKEIQLLAPTDDRIWARAFPSMSGSEFPRNGTLEALVLSEEPFDKDKNITMQLSFLDNIGGNSPVRTSDDLKVKYLGTSVGSFNLVMTAIPSEEGEGHSVKWEAKEIELSDSTGFSIISRAFAESTDSLLTVIDEQGKSIEIPENLSSLSKDELINIVRIIVRENRALRANLGMVNVVPTSEASSNSAGETEDWSDVSIVYYSKKGDSNRVIDVLDKLSTANFVVPSKLEGKTTNALWFGRDIEPKRAAEIAKRLISEGIKLQYFGYFGQIDQKTNRIEIGHSAESISNAFLTVEDIDKAAATIEFPNP